MSTVKFEQQMAQVTQRESRGETRTKFAARRKEKEAKKPVTDIESNPYYQAGQEKNPEKRKQLMRELSTFTDSETTQKNKKALDEFTAHIQYERQEMASKLIALTNTETFSHIQEVLDTINTDLLNFEDQISPFMEIISAIRAIQGADATADLIKEIQEDEQRSVERHQEMSEKKREVKNLKKDITAAEVAISLLKENKGSYKWLGLGDMRPEVSAKISRYEEKVAECKAKISTLTEAIAVLEKEQKEASKFADLEKEKVILAGFLNLRSEEHKEKHQELINTAQSFVSTTQKRVHETLEHSVGLDDQIRNLSDLSFKMQTQYATLVEAIKEAEVDNDAKYQELQQKAETLEDDPLGRIENESLQRDLARHIDALNSSKTDSVEELQDLAVAGKRVDNMAVANQKQIQKTRKISTSGIAGVADNLSTVLTSINQAALDQASTAAAQSLRRMNNNTIDLVKEQMLNQTQAQQNETNELVKRLEELSGFGEVVTIVNEEQREALAENRAVIDDLMAAAEEVQEVVREGRMMNPDVISEEMQEKQQ